MSDSQDHTDPAPENPDQQENHNPQSDEDTVSGGAPEEPEQKDLQ